MPHAKLSTQAIGLMLAVRSMEDTAPIAVKEMRKQLFASAKASFGIPDSHAVKVDIDTPGAMYGVLVRKKGNDAYLLDPTDGRWIGAARAPVAPPPEAARWFAVDVDDLVNQIADNCDFEDGSVTTPDRAPVDTRFSAVGKEFILDTDGDLFVQLSRSEF
jgi:hypothetical protein